jgi:hypothetical protein
MEYAPFQSLANRNPGAPPTAGKIFRFDTNRWYTIEIRYKFNSPGAQNGVIETWIDGVKVYSAADLETCAPAQYGDCTGLGALYLGAYHNALDKTVWNGQQVIDNLIVSRAYIGPPGGSTMTSKPPSAPGNLRVSP